MGGKLVVETRSLVYPRDLCDPKDWLNFVQLSPFESSWKKLGLADDDLRALEICVMIDPQRPSVVAGTGGVRKLRFSPPQWNRGKSGALRICYAFFPAAGLVVLIAVYGKESKDNLTPEEKRVIKGLMGEIGRYLEGMGNQAKGV